MNAWPEALLTHLSDTCKSSSDNLRLESACGVVEGSVLVDASIFRRQASHGDISEMFLGCPPPPTTEYEASRWIRILTNRIRMSEVGIAGNPMEHLTGSGKRASAPPGQSKSVKRARVAVDTPRREQPLRKRSRPVSYKEVDLPKPRRKRVRADESDDEEDEASDYTGDDGESGDDARDGDDGESSDDARDGGDEPVRCRRGGGPTPTMTALGREMGLLSPGDSNFLKACKFSDRSKKTLARTPNVLKSNLARLLYRLLSDMPHKTQKSVLWRGLGAGVLTVLLYASMSPELWASFTKHCAECDLESPTWSDDVALQLFRQHVSCGQQGGDFVFCDSVSQENVYGIGRRGGRRIGITAQAKESLARANKQWPPRSKEVVAALAVLATVS